MWLLEVLPNKNLPLPSTKNPFPLLYCVGGVEPNAILPLPPAAEFISRLLVSSWNVSVLISEWANSGDLLDYIRKNYQNFNLKIWRVIIFQILSVLSVIHAKYASFRHNDIKANNILVNIIDKTNKPLNFQ